MKWWILAAGVLLFTVAAQAQSCPTVPPTGAITWTTQWCDEFNGTAGSAIDNTKWQFDTGILHVNNELEYYCSPGSSTSPCDPATSNAQIDGAGHLLVQALRINSSTTPYSGSWTSARLNTANNLASFQYGRIEASMQLPIGAGIWPAFWSLGTNITTVGWPASGEMDFMENVPVSGGLGPTKVESSMHGVGYNGGNSLHAIYTFPSGDVTSFHAYGAIWSPSMVQFYVDDPSNVFEVRTANDPPGGASAWAFNHPFFVLLNLAMGGDFPGPPDGSTPSPAVMLVDYVRVYQPSAVAAPDLGIPAAITVNAGAPGHSTVNLTSTSGSGRVYLSCSVTAPKSTCAINSSDPLDAATVDFSSTGTGTALVNVTTTANTSAANVAGKHRITALAMILPLLALVVIVRLPKARTGIASGIVFLAILAMPGCGGSSGGGGGGNNSGTPPGSYTVTVTATTVSGATSTVNIALTVK